MSKKQPTAKAIEKATALVEIDIRAAVNAVSSAYDSVNVVLTLAGAKALNKAVAKLQKLTEKAETLLTPKTIEE